MSANEDSISDEPVTAEQPIEDVSSEELFDRRDEFGLDVNEITRIQRRREAGMDVPVTLPEEEPPETAPAPDPDPQPSPPPEQPPQQPADDEPRQLLPEGPDNTTPRPGGGQDDDQPSESEPTPADDEPRQLLPEGPDLETPRPDTPADQPVDEQPRQLLPEGRDITTPRPGGGQDDRLPTVEPQEPAGERIDPSDVPEEVREDIFDQALSDTDQFGRQDIQFYREGNIFRGRIAPEAELREAGEEIAPQLQEQFSDLFPDRTYERGDEFRVRRTAEGFESEFTASFETDIERAQRQQAGEDIAPQLEEQFSELFPGRQFELGDEFELRQTEEGFESVLTSTFRQQFERAQRRRAGRDIGEQFEEQFADLFPGRSFERGDEFRLQRTEEGFTAQLTPGFREDLSETQREELAEDILAEAGEGFTFEDIQFEQTDEGVSARLSPGAIRRETEEDVAGELERDFRELFPNRQFEAGDEFTLDRSEEGFNVELSESFRGDIDQARRQQLAERTESFLREELPQISIFRAEDRLTEEPLNLGDEILVRETEEGRLRAMLDPQFAGEIAPLAESITEPETASPIEIQGVFDAFGQSLGRIERFEQRQSIAEEAGVDVEDVHLEDGELTGETLAAISRANARDAGRDLTEPIGNEFVSDGPSVESGGVELSIEDIQSAEDAAVEARQEEIQGALEGIGFFDEQAVQRQEQIEVVEDRQAAAGRLSGAMSAAAAGANIQLEGPASAEEQRFEQAAETFDALTPEPTAAGQTEAILTGQVPRGRAGAAERLEGDGPDLSIDDRERPEEQFGDVAIPVGGGARLEDYLRAGADKFSETLGDLTQDPEEAGENEIVLRSATADALRAAGRGELAEDVESKLGKVVRGGGAILNVPATGLFVKEGVEFVGAGGSALASDLQGEIQTRPIAGVDGGRTFDFEQSAEFASEAGAAGQQAADAFVDYASENPIETGALLAGSLLASGAIMGGASRISSRAGLASRFAIQPGEELAGIAGYNVARPLVGTSRAGRLFPGTGRLNREPLILSEETAIRGIQRARASIKSKAATARALTEGEVSLGPSPRQAELIDRFRPGGPSGTAISGDVEPVRAAAGPSEPLGSVGRGSILSSNPKISVLAGKKPQAATSLSRQSSIQVGGYEIQLSDKVGAGLVPPVEVKRVETEFEPSRGEVLGEGFSETARTEMIQDQLTQRRQFGGTFEGETDPLRPRSEAGRRQAEATEREITYESEAGRSLRRRFETTLGFDETADSQGSLSRLQDATRPEVTPDSRPGQAPAGERGPFGLDPIGTGPGIDQRLLDRGGLAAEQESATRPRLTAETEPGVDIGTRFQPTLGFRAGTDTGPVSLFYQGSEILSRTGMRQDQFLDLEFETELADEQMFELGTRSDIDIIYDSEQRAESEFETELEFEFETESEVEVEPFGDDPDRGDDELDERAFFGDRRLLERELLNPFLGE